MDLIDPVQLICFGQLPSGKGLFFVGLNVSLSLGCRSSRSIHDVWIPINFQYVFNEC